ncbi:MAG: protein translocase subunit SecF [Patescibacteria group bacterium]
MYRIVQKRNYLFALSLALLVPGMIALIMWGLRLGIDFSGGTLASVSIPSAPQADEVRTAVEHMGLGETSVQSAGTSTYDIRLPYLSNEQHETFTTQLTGSFPDATVESFETIGPTIGNELRQRAILAVTLVLVAILIYISWAFRKVSRGPVPSWVYGLSALIALVHDILMLIGIFAIIGHYFRVDINSLFVTALLTVLGFSVHDTIVVFDRIRERLRVSAQQTYEGIVNESLNQTMVRSLNTSLTTVIVLLALFFFGGESIRMFVLALVIGIVSGTYSSIFVAAPLLVVYERIKARRSR